MKQKISAVAIALCIFATAPAASAHTVLVSTNPVVGSIIKELPVQIILKFADPLLTLGKRVVNRVRVTAPNGQVISFNKNQTHGVTLINGVQTSSPHNGIYKVSYRVSAQDGHVVTGTYTFTLKN